MRRALVFLLVSVVGWLCTPSAEAARAGSPTLDEIVAGVEATYKDVTTLKASFVQVTWSTATGEGPKQRGEVLFKRPRSMRWDFKGPDARLFVTDGSQIWVYSPGANQCIQVKDMGGASASGSFSLLDELDALHERYDLSLAEPDGRRKDHLVLLLAPKKAEGAHFKQLRLQLSRKKYMVQKVTITDAVDNVTELSFSQVRLNVDLPDKVFSFTPPSGCELVSADGL